MSTNKPLEPPIMDPLNLVTMTKGVKVKQNFNLKVIAEKMEVDIIVTGIKYLSVKKGDYKKVVIRSLVQNYLIMVNLSILAVAARNMQELLLK